MPACEKCWADAHFAAALRGVDQSKVYRELVAERDCTPEEQCGEMHLVIEWDDREPQCRCGKVIREQGGAS
jgi:hypothetical protein